MRTHIRKSSSGIYMRRYLSTYSVYVTTYSIHTDTYTLYIYQSSSEQMGEASGTRRCWPVCCLAPSFLVLSCDRHRRLSSSLALTNSVPWPCPLRQSAGLTRASPHESVLAARGPCCSVCYGRGAFWQQGGKERLENKPRCADERGAGLLVLQDVPICREEVGVFQVGIRSLL